MVCGEGVSSTAHSFFARQLPCTLRLSSDTTTTWYCDFFIPDSLQDYSLGLYLGNPDGGEDIISFVIQDKATTPEPRPLIRLMCWSDGASCGNSDTNFGTSLRNRWYHMEMVHRIGDTELIGKIKERDSGHTIFYDTLPIGDPTAFDSIGWIAVGAETLNKHYFDNVCLTHWPPVAIEEKTWSCIKQLYGTR
jgi:hypothetical protein